MPVLEEKQKVRKLDLSKFKNHPVREISTSCPAPSAIENSRDMMHNEGKSKTEEDRRIVLELLNEERDIDCYSDTESELDYDYQSYVQIKF